MKKIIAYLVVTAMLFTLLPMGTVMATTGSDELAGTKVVAKDEMSHTNTANGATATPTGMSLAFTTTSTDSATATPVDLGGGNKALQIGPGKLAVDYMKYTLNTPIAGDYMVTFKVKINNWQVGSTKGEAIKFTLYGDNEARMAGGYFQMPSAATSTTIGNEFMYRSYYFKDSSSRDVTHQDKVNSIIPLSLISGTTAEYNTAWFTVKYVADYDAGTFDVYIDNTKIRDDIPAMGTATTQESGYGTNTDAMKLCSIALTKRLSNTQVNSQVYIDDIEVTEIKPMDAKMTAADDDNALDKAKLTLNNAAISTSVSASNVKLVTAGGDVAATSVTPIGTDGKNFEVTFPAALSLETDYSIKLSGFKDDQEQVINKTITYRTRDKRLNIADAKFYTDYGVVGSQAEISNLSAQTITAAIDINNETATNFTGDMIVVHKQGDKIISANAVDASVAGEATATITADLAVTSAGINDKLEVYLWDSVKGEKSLYAVQTLKSSGKEKESDYAGNDATSITTNLAIDSVNFKATVSGQASSSDKTEVTSLILKPGYTIDTLTKSNFGSAVMCIGQKASGTDGSYDFIYILDSGSFTNGSEYTAVTGTNGNKNTDSSKFFSVSTVNAAISAVNGSTPEQLLAYLNNTTELLAGINLNDVLQMNLSVYNTLKQPIEVCKVISAMSFSDIPTISTEFAAATTARKDKENRIDTLIASVDTALWDDIENILLTDKNGLNDLELSWTGNYATIENNGSAKILFYKRLASNYTFTDLSQLQSAFTSEPAIVLQLLQAQNQNNSSSGSSGGGGGGISFNNGYGKDEKPTPIAPQNETVKIEFTDLDSVPWAAEYIKTLAELNFVNGIGNDEFGPNLHLTREQFVKMIVVALGLYNENAPSTDFIDVDETHWSGKYVASAVERGIVYGLDSQHFGVGQRITRAEMAVILHRAASSVGIDLSDSGSSVYADNSDIPDYAKGSVNIVSELGLMSGVGENCFAPRDYTTRAMAAKVICLLREAVQ